MVYLLGYRKGTNDYSWCMDFFKLIPPLYVKLSHKDVMALGFKQFCGIGPKIIEPCDYYIARDSSSEDIAENLKRIKATN